MWLVHVRGEFQRQLAGANSRRVIGGAAKLWNQQVMRSGINEAP